MVPGVAPPQQKEGKSAARNRKKKEAKKSEGSASPAPEGSNDSVPAESVVSLEEKKIRSLLKKIRAIETLKMKQASGESLEDTQVSKINKEDEIRKELADLGWTDSS
ncbi:hypothetical protein ACNR90_003453 [Candidozyma auris]